MKLVKLSASWCGPCKAYAPVFDKWAESNPDIETQSMDVDKDEVPSEWEVRNVPTTVMIDYEGNLVGKEVGMLTEDAIQAFVDKHPGD